MKEEYKGKATAKVAELGKFCNCKGLQVLTVHCECVQIGPDFLERLASSHDTGCPRDTSACDPSLAQFPPLDRSVVAADFATQETSVGRLYVLPPIA